MSTRTSFYAVPLFLALLAACESTSPPSGPPTPEAVVATVTHGEITVSWRDLTDNKATYEVEFSLDATNWTPLKKAAGITTVTQQGIEYQVKYYYRVRACTDAGCSAWVQASTEWTGGQGPQAFAIRAITGTTSANISANVDHGGLRTLVHFLVTTQGEKPYSTPDIILSPRVPGLQESAPVTQLLYGLKEGTTYGLVLVATNGAGDTQASGGFITSVTGPPIVTLGTKVDILTPASGIRLAAIVDPGGQTTNTWFEVVPTDSAFAASPHYTTTLPTIATGFVSNISATLPTLRSNTSYKYRGAASNSFGTAFSDSAFFKTQ